MFQIRNACSKAVLVSASDERVRASLAAGRGVDLIVPSVRWGTARKRQLLATAPFGVSVHTYDQWLAGLWELYGDGSKIVDAPRRRVLVRPLVERVGLLESRPSPVLVDELCTFVQEAVCLLGAYPGELDDSQEKMRELVSLYADALAAHGMVECAQVERSLAEEALSHNVVAENAVLQPGHRLSFLKAISSNVDVTVLGRSLPCEVDAAAFEPAASQASGLQELRRVLYAGTAALEPDGSVFADEARGAHAEPFVLIERLRSFGPSGTTCIVFPNAADSYPAMLEALACANIPFEAEFSLPVSRTALGAAFLSLARFCASSGSDEGYVPLVGFLASPYSGVEPKDARALQMRWREQACSTPEARLHDITEGFARGNASAKVTKERLAPLAALLGMEPCEQARTLFDNAKAAHVPGDVLVDDAKAANALLEYFDVCGELGAEPDLAEMANLSIHAFRCSGDAEDAVLLAGPEAVGLERYDHVIVAGLDTVHHPMARRQSPFDPLLAKLGVGGEDLTALFQRVFLLDAIESARSGFAACRATHAADGVELCQSALWDELMSAYRTEEDDENGLASHVVPPALREAALSVSEARQFASDEQEDGERRAVVRGSIEHDEALPYLMCGISGDALPFSPTGIEDYYRCPYRWFTCRRVNFNGMDRSFDAAAQGNLVHAVFERFYRMLKAQGAARVTEDNLAFALDVASQAFDAQVEHDRGKSRSGLFLKTERDEQVLSDMRGLILDFVRREATFLPGFVPTYFELNLGKDTGTVLEYAGVFVRGKVDRIDVDAEGNAIVIDYKLSSLSEGYGLHPDKLLPSRIQTDIYATLVQRHFDLLGTPLKVRGSVYRSYARNALRGVYDRGIEWGPQETVRADRDGLPRAGSDETYDEYLAHVEAEVAQCMEHLAAGDIAPDPLQDDASVCDYCKALLFCPKAKV